MLALVSINHHSLFFELKNGFVLAASLHPLPNHPQTPFWFAKLPEMQPVKDEFGEIIADQLWIEFGPIVNRK